MIKGLLNDGQIFDLNGNSAKFHIRHLGQNESHDHKSFDIHYISSVASEFGLKLMNTCEKTPPAKTLVVLGVGPSVEVSLGASNKGFPRADYLEIAKMLNADLMSFHLAESERGQLFRRIFSSRQVLGSVWAAFCMRRKYHHMYATGEDIGLPLAILLKLSRWRGKITFIVHKSFTLKRKVAFWLADGHIIHKLICVSQAQRDILVEKWGISSQRVVAIGDAIDEKFFDVSDLESTLGDYVFACGAENRDYETLAKAAALVPFQIRVAGSGWNNLSGTRDLAEPIQMKNIIREQRLSFEELKQRYANARFVVVPLNDVPYAAGVTGIMEGMSMRKALVVTASHGVEEYLKPGLSALTVLPGDPAKLAEAMCQLWDDQKRANEMGEYNYRWLKKDFSFEAYCQANVQIVLEGLKGTA